MKILEYTVTVSIPDDSEVPESALEELCDALDEGGMRALIVDELASLDHSADLHGTVEVTVESPVESPADVL